MISGYYDAMSIVVGGGSVQLPCGAIKYWKNDNFCKGKIRKTLTTDDRPAVTTGEQ